MILFIRNTYNHIATATIPTRKENTMMIPISNN